MIKTVVDVDLMVPLCGNGSTVRKTGNPGKLPGWLCLVVLLDCEQLSHPVREERVLAADHIVKVTEHPWKHMGCGTVEDLKGVARRTVIIQIDECCPDRSR